MTTRLSGAAEADNGQDCDMNRGQLAFMVLVNAMVSLVIAIAVIWVFEARRPDPEELAAINTPRAEPVLVEPAVQPTATPDAAVASPAPAVATETPTPETVNEVVEEVYVVQPGDTMLVIATRYNVAVQDILDANNLSDPNFVFAGQRLVIPVPGGSPSAGTPAGGEVAPSVEPTATVAAAPTGVQITAITSVGDLANEQVVLVNESDTAYSLQGWQVQRAGGPIYTFSRDVPLLPGSSIRLHTAAGADTSIDLFWGLTEAAWLSGAEAQVISSQGEVVSNYVVP